MSPVRLATTLAALALPLALPLSAAAKLPAPATKTIVFGKSVGGVKLGMTLTAAKRAWGAGSSCGPGATPPSQPSTACTWSTTPGAKPDRGAQLGLLAEKGKIVAITVANGSGAAKAGLAKFRTANGIAIGSTLAAVRKAYPKLGALSGTPASANAELGSGKTVTSLFFVSGKLESIQIGSPF